MNNDPLAVEYYSVRRLSPFQGVIHITQTQQARALSVDGIHWQLQIHHDMPRPRWGSLDNLVMTRRYLRYGVWKRGDGISRLPIPPNVDADIVKDMAAELLHALACMPSKTRFPLADLVELWVLDAKHRLPLALLATALSREKRRAIRTIEWIGSSAHDKNSSPTGSAEVLTQELRISVERLVNTTSGMRGQAQWFERTASGAGIGLGGVRLDAGLRNRRLPATEFPELPLKANWPEQTQTETVRDFHAWQAPTLLTLPNLPHKIRHTLEISAARRPLTLHALHRLYPEIIHKQLITKALVEAKIRQANANSQTA